MRSRRVSKLLSAAVDAQLLMIGGGVLLRQEQHAAERAVWLGMPCHDHDLAGRLTGRGELWQPLTPAELGIPCLSSWLGAQGTAIANVLEILG